ncbi:MAG: TonB-dependent receptor [Methylobacter sp.]|nr:TonB-dependent receptor [Methylobacter sp.]
MNKRYRFAFFAPVSLALMFTLTPALADKPSKDKEQDTETEQDDIKNLDTMVIVGEVIDPPFESKTLVRSNLGMANDGAELLKQTPGISLIRQGGTGSDPVFRGLGGSRLNTIIDGVPFGGACNHRMDPATSYIKPGSFKSFDLLQGPQSVRSGNSITGAVRFERDDIRFDDPGIKTYNSYLYGSFNRQDITTNDSAGFEYGYFNYSGNRTRGGNYEDGNGETVQQTQYDTWSDRYAVGFTPDEDTSLEFALQRSNGFMGNATIHMDATSLDRDNYTAHFKRKNISTWLKNMDLQYSYTAVDHYMDNFTLRPLKPGHEFVIMGQDWEQNFVKNELTFELHKDIELITGVEYRKDKYGANAVGGNPRFVPIPNMENVPKTHILDFENFAGYAELAYHMNDQLRWVTGLRGDTLRTDTGTMKAGGETSNIVLSGSNKDRHQDMFGAFARGEYEFETVPMQLSLGYGHAERAHDFWEVYSMDAFALNAERNNELDGKLSYQGDKLKAQVSAFYSRIDDFILVYRGSSAANIDAERAGGEFSVEYPLTEEFSVSGNTSYVYGQNLTQDVALAQTPPLEGTLGLNYAQGPFRASFKQRLVAEQTRIHSGYGNVLALDSTETAGFMTSSLQLGYKPIKAVDLNFGIDNLFNKDYSEHLNRVGSATVAGPAPTKLIEPGRAIWGRVSVDFDY